MDDLSGWTVQLHPAAREERDNNNRWVVFNRFALWLDGLTRGALVPFGPFLVHRLFVSQPAAAATFVAGGGGFTNAAALVNTWSYVAVPFACAVASYPLGRALGCELAQRVHLGHGKDYTMVARLGGVALALHVYTFGAGLTSVYWLILIRFSSASLSGLLCQLTATTNNSSSSKSTQTDNAKDEMLALEAEKMESGVLCEKPTSSLQKISADLDIAARSAKIYATGFALSILLGGLLYKKSMLNATFQSLTGVNLFSMSPFFFVMTALLLELLLRALFVAVTEDNNSAQDGTKRKTRFSAKVVKVGGAVRRLVGRVVNRRRRNNNNKYTDSNNNNNTFVDVEMGRGGVLSSDLSRMLDDDDDEFADQSFYDPLNLSRHLFLETNSVRSGLDDEFFDCHSALGDEDDNDDDALDEFGLDASKASSSERFLNHHHGVALYKNRKCVYADGTPAFVTPGDSEGCVPSNFVSFCGGNQIKARKMWEATQQWRRERQVWKIHSMPNRWFPKIKQAYPHFIHGHSKAGYPIIYEQPGRMNLKNLFRNGCEISDMAHHYIFFMEFVSNCICARDDVRAVMGPNAPPHSSSSWGIMVVMDVRGAGLSHLSGDVVKYLKQAGDINSCYYPLSMKRAFLVNSPFWLAGAWSGIKVILPDSVQVDILSETKYPQALRDYIDQDQIPPEYGGTSPYPLGEHPYEVQLRELVELAERAQDEESDVVATTESLSTRPTPPTHAAEYRPSNLSSETSVTLLSSPSIQQQLKRPTLPLSPLDSNSHPLRRRTVSADRVRWQEPLTHGRGESYNGDKEPTEMPEFEIFIITTMVHVIWSAVQGAMECIVPMWILSPPLLGGLGYMPSRSGVALFCSAVVLLWVMRTKALSRVVSRIPTKSPMRAFRIGVGARAVLLLLLALYPTSIVPDARTNSILVMTSTIIIISCLVLSSVLGSSGSSSLHRLATESFARRLARDPRSSTWNSSSGMHYLMSAYEATTTATTTTSRLTLHAALVGEVFGMLTFAPLFAWSTAQDRPAPFDATCCFYMASLLSFVLYVSSFSLHWSSSSGEFAPHPNYNSNNINNSSNCNSDGCNTSDANTKRCCSLAAEIIAVLVSDVASLWEDANLSPSIVQRLAAANAKTATTTTNNNNNNNSSTKSSLSSSSPSSATKTLQQQQ